MKGKSLFIVVLVFILVLTACGQHSQMSWQEQYNLGMRFLSEGNYEEAIIAFTTAIEIDPKQPNALISRGEAYILSGKTESNLLAAEKDYLAALELNERLEDVYVKLSELYLDMGDEERSLNILEKGFDILHTEAMEEKVVQRKIGSITDRELIDCAEETIDDVYGLGYYIGLGAYFEFDFDNPVVDGNGRYWFPVVDKRVHSLEDVVDYWRKYFSVSYPLPEMINFREIDGQLYSGCEGVGGDMSLLDYQLTDVQSREGTSAVLTGYILREDWNESGVSEYRNHFQYRMKYEDGMWKCAGWKEGNVIVDAVPDNLEEFPDFLANTFWRWKVSSGNGGTFFARFYGDGTFSYIRATDLFSSIGTYEYDGEYLYLEGIKYENEEDSFYSIEGYDVVGGLDRHYELVPDEEQVYLKLEAQLEGLMNKEMYDADGRLIYSTERA